MITIVATITAEWFPTIITRYPEDDVLDPYVGYLGRNIDKDISGPAIDRYLSRPKRHRGAAIMLVEVPPG